LGTENFLGLERARDLAQLHRQVLIPMGGWCAPRTSLIERTDAL
jgi:hypothetical protein